MPWGGQSGVAAAMEDGDHGTRDEIDIRVVRAKGLRWKDGAQVGQACYHPRGGQ